VEERFKQLAALVGHSTRFSSSSTVVLHDVTHKASNTPPSACCVDNPRRSASILKSNYGSIN
jgi:hypothetical protein